MGNPQYRAAISKSVEAGQEISTERNDKLRTLAQDSMAKASLAKRAEIAQALNLRGIQTAPGEPVQPDAHSPPLESRLNFYRLTTPLSGMVINAYE